MAGKVMKANGYAATGIDGLMQESGVTSGAFYGHFDSKTDLLRALIVSELEHSRSMLASPAVDHAGWLRHLVKRYLRPSHVAHPEAGCVLPALAAEISRADLKTRKVLEAELCKWQQDFSERLGNDERGWAFLCQLVGGVLLARAVSSEKLQHSILSGSRRFLEESIAQLEQTEQTKPCIPN